MPRMNLTDEESKLIFRKREVEEAHRAGWNKALAYIEAEFFKNDNAEPVSVGGGFLRKFLKEAKR